MLFYSGTKCVSTALLFPSIILHSTMTFFMIGPVHRKRDSSKETKFAISRTFTWVNIITASASTFLIAVLFEKSSRNEKGETLLVSNTKFDYESEAYQLWKTESNDSYSIYDPSAVIKIIILVVPPFLISLIVTITLLIIPKFCVNLREIPIGVLDPDHPKIQFTMKNGIIEEEMNE